MLPALRSGSVVFLCSIRENDRRIEKPGKEGPVGARRGVESTALIMLCHCEFRYGQVDLLCRLSSARVACLRSETETGEGKLAHLRGYAGLKSIALCERRHRFGFCCSPRIMPFLWGTGSDGRARARAQAEGTE